MSSLSPVFGPLKPVPDQPDACPLGTTAKSSPPPPDGVKISRSIRYQAQSQARHILQVEARRRMPEKYPGDVYRTADCRYVNHGDVEIHHSAQFQAAHYVGLVSCGSVWACPVCASKIQERRRLEIEHAIQWAESQGLVPVMVTFTFPHHSWNRLRDLISQQREAFRYLRKGKAWDRVKARSGLIRSLEVTHGRNGWHPHTHELWFCDPDNIPQPDVLVRLWESACRRAGLLQYRPDDPATSPKWMSFMLHSVHVQRDMTAGDYLAKQDDSRTWGFSHELAKATSKSGRAKGVHPHHFLFRKAPGDDRRYLEYVDAMKGARQLFWSPGLKDRCGLEDLSDSVVAEESREAADVLASLTPEHWNLVRSNDARSKLLDVAESSGLSGVWSLLALLGATELPAPGVSSRSDGEAPGRAGFSRSDVPARPGAEAEPLGTTPVAANPLAP